jgi:RNA polymerase sigma-70 factor, ECF subfamily
MSSYPPEQTVTRPVACASTSGCINTAELVDRLCATDLDLLFERYSRLVLGTAYRVLGDVDEAEEVLQDVFFYLCRKSHLFDPAKGSVKSWILQITLSRSIDRKLYLARRRFHAGEAIDSLQLVWQADLDQQIDSKLSREYLERAFADLTEMQRRTIESFYFDGLDLKEISEQLSEPLGRVRHYFYRGLERLRKSSILLRLRL